MTPGDIVELTGKQGNAALPSWLHYHLHLRDLHDRWLPSEQFCAIGECLLRHMEYLS